MPNRYLAAAALALAAASPLPSQAVPGRPPVADSLDLASAVRAARAANPRLSAADALVAAAGARIAPAGALPDPTLTFGAMNYMARGLAPDPVMTMQQLTLMQMVPLGGVRGLRRALARQDSARVAMARDGAALDVERQVRERFFEVHHLDRRLALLERTAALVREAAATATAMYAVGSASQSDVVRAQLAITRVSESAAALRLRRTRAEAALRAALGRTDGAPLVPVARRSAASAPEDTLSLPPVPELDSLAAAADTANPEIRAARAMQGSARENERLARRMLWPDLSVGVSYGRRPGSDDMVSAMVGVSLPVFAGSRQLRMRDESRAMREGADAEFRAMRLEVHAMLATAHAEATTARAQAALYTSTLLPQAAATVEAALAAYRVGRVDFMTVLDALMTELDARQELEDYSAMYQAAVAELDRLAGRSFAPTSRRED